MSQTWENAQERGVVRLGETTVAFLGRQYQLAAYEAAKGQPAITVGNGLKP